LNRIGKKFKIKIEKFNIKNKIPRIQKDGDGEIVKRIFSLGFQSLTSSNQHENILYVKIKPKMTRSNALFDTRSKSNLIEENIIEKLFLGIHYHANPYSWISGNG